MKKVWSIFLVIAMVLTVAVVPVSADPEYDPWRSIIQNPDNVGIAFIGI